MTSTLDLPAQVAFAVAPPPKVSLRKLSTLTWREFVLGVRDHTVELPKPWSYPEDRIHWRPRRVNPDEVVAYVAVPHDATRLPYVRELYWAICADAREPFAYRCDYEPYPPNPPLKIDTHAEHLPSTDNRFYNTPNYALFNWDARSDDVLILHHPAAILAPDPDDEQPLCGYAIGPFYVAIHFEPDCMRYPRWHAVRPPDAPRGACYDCRESASNHPNLLPEPCYGYSDWKDLLMWATREHEWGDILFIIHRFLNSWNPKDRPMGHPRELCHARVPWSGEPSDLLFYDDDECGTVECARCGYRLNEDTIYNADDSDDNYCAECYNHLYCSCAMCDCTMPRADVYTVDSDDDTRYCRRCFYERHYDCENCGTAVAIAEARDPRRAYCESCLVRLFFPCQDCDVWEDRDRCFDKQQTFCDNCFEVRVAGGDGSGSE